MTAGLRVTWLWLVLSAPSHVAAQDDAGNLEQHEYFRGDHVTTTVDQGDWYRDIRTGNWREMGFSEQRLAEVLAEIRDKSKSDTLVDLDHQAWSEGWMTAARQAENQAAASYDADEQEALLREASAAWMIASYPHNDADLARWMMAESAAAYVEAANISRAGRVQLIDVPGDGFTTKALLHLPASQGPYPVVMLSGGIDVVLTEHLRYFDRYFEPAGVAYLTFDIPAVGFNQGMRLEPGNTSIVHHAVFDAIRSNDALDENRVVALSSSGGGLSIVNFAVENQELKAAVSRCGLVDGPLRKPHALPMLPAMTLDAWSTRIGADSANLDKVLASSAPLSLVGSGLLDGTIRTAVPLLAISTHDDPTTPPEDMLATARASASGQVAFFGRNGHCPKSLEAEEFVADYLLRHLGAGS